MSKDYNKMYQDKLNSLKKKILGTEIYDALEIKSISNQKVDNICAAITKITGKPVYEDFNFRTGKIFGILKAIAQNAKHREDLLTVTGLTKEYIDIYFNVAGNLPYVTKDGKINVGRPMDVKATKEFIAIVAANFDILVEEQDLADITQERWDRMYDMAMEKVVETIKHNEQYAETVPTEYEE